MKLVQAIGSAWLYVVVIGELYNTCRAVANVKKPVALSGVRLKSEVFHKVETPLYTTVPDKPSANSTCNPILSATNASLLPQIMPGISLAWLSRSIHCVTIPIPSKVTGAEFEAVDAIDKAADESMSKTRRFIMLPPASCANPRNRRSRGLTAGVVGLRGWGRGRDVAFADSPSS